MVIYQYTLVANNRRRKTMRMTIAQPHSDPYQEIMIRVIRDRQWQLFCTLFSRFPGDYNNIQHIRRYLPSQYKDYAHDLPLLREQLFNETVFQQNYHIENITTVKAD